VKVLDLFSGIGGFSLGLERAGMRTVAFCEIEPFPRKVLAKHWPNVPIYDDVRTLTAKRLAADGIDVDVICGGFPCQDISEAGRRIGLKGERSGLWTEFSRLIDEIGPKFVVVENVSELLVSAMGDVLRDLAEIGYDAEWHSIPACAIGADHIRERIWIVAYPNSTRAKITSQCGRIQCTQEVGQDAPEDYADGYGSRSSRGLPSGTLNEDARAISPRLGFALSVAPSFPGIDGAGSPVLGRGEDGIPHRVDRLYAIGNAVVPQIPELIGRAIMASDGVAA
jgi:DNA (cytosine-5)-methyltransferase 1